MDIVDYLRLRNREAAARVGAAIRHSIEAAAGYPHLGRLQGEGVRKIVELRFGYLIYYDVSSNPDELRVVTIRHPARARPFSDG